MWLRVLIVLSCIFSRSICSARLPESDPGSFKDSSQNDTPDVVDLENSISDETSAKKNLQDPSLLSILHQSENPLEALLGADYANLDTDGIRKKLPMELLSNENFEDLDISIFKGMANPVGIINALTQVNPEMPIVQNVIKECVNRLGRDRIKLMVDEMVNVGMCLLEEFNVTQIRHEMDIAIIESRGGLNDLFQMYCGKQVPGAFDCLRNAVGIIKPCLIEQELEVLKTYINMLEGAADFWCEEQGIKFALFFYEKGDECLMMVEEKLPVCFEEERSYLDAHGMNLSRALLFEKTALTEKNCESWFDMHKCIVKTMKSECATRVPGDLIDGLLKSMELRMPCATLSGVQRVNSWLSLCLSLPVILLHFARNLGS
ncbi:unnamed protein product [Darwinula stevensoni]|uniref:Uncharacterized protein n=1 Tax=Darwinula stevensoni TaxID=69355 RepID=A0A7R8XLB0_9CRUS|nr:unnamed protein product [Darwinula stevensoni]CAG0894026.1 unnamed protein product [Darwinula stevensoni]